MTHAQANWFELEVDKNSYDATDFSVLATGLPPDAGFHEVVARCAARSLRFALTMP